MTGNTYIGGLALLILIFAAVSDPAKAEDYSTIYTINHYGVTQWQVDSQGNRKFYDSRSNWMVSGKNNAFEDFNQRVTSSETKSFLGQEFKSNEFSGYYTKNKKGKVTESTSRETTESDFMGIKGKESEWNYSYEKKFNYGEGDKKPSTIENPNDTYRRDPIDGKVYDGKGQVITDGQAKDYSVKQESLSGQNIAGKTAKALKDHTTATFYEREFGKFNRGVYGYNNETGELDGNLQILGIESGGAYKFDASKDGIGGNVNYGIDVIGIKYGNGTEFQLGSQTEVHANYEVYAKAFAKGNIDAKLGMNGGKLKAGGGIGAIAGGEASGDVEIWGGIIKLTGSAEGGYGAQLKGHIDGELSTSKIKFNAGGGLALGLGGGLDGGVELNLEKLADNLSAPAVTYIEAIQTIQNTYNSQATAIRRMIARGASPEELKQRLMFFDHNNKEMINQLNQIIDEVPWWLPGRSVVLYAAQTLRDDLLAADHINDSMVADGYNVSKASPGTPLPDAIKTKDNSPGTVLPGMTSKDWENPNGEWENSNKDWENPNDDWGNINKDWENPNKGKDLKTLFQ